MDIVLDTSSIVNLINGSVLDRVIKINGYRYFIGEHLLGREILNDLQKIIVEAFIEKRKILVLSSIVTVSSVIDLQNKLKLGLGETECILLCKANDSCVCTDDLKARKLATIEIGAPKVFGSLSLLKECVAKGIVSCTEALASYQAMIEKGGFLPRNLTAEYFCQ